ncbi:ATP-binding protein [Patescibacteria group bacterium]|nr:ATP-binding protein [Patescibacteria group bacterium]
MSPLLIAILILFIAFLIFAALKRFLKPSAKEAFNHGNFEILEIKVRKSDTTDNTFNQSALAAENLFASLHGLLREEQHLQEHFSFEIAADPQGGIKFYVAVPTSIAKFVEGQIYAQYPNAQITVVQDYMDKIDFQGTPYESNSLVLAKEDFFPFKSFRDFEVDPLSAISTVMSQTDVNEHIIMQFLARPVADGWQDRGYAYVKSIRDGTAVKKNQSFVKTMFSSVAKESVGIVGGILVGAFKYQEAVPVKPGGGGGEDRAPRLNPVQELQVRSIENKLSKMGFEVEVRAIVVSSAAAVADSKLRHLAASFQQFSVNGLNNFLSRKVENKALFVEKFRKRSFEPENTYLLSNEELASVFHLPSNETDAPTISWVYSRKSEPPANLPTDKCVYIGETVFRSKKVKFGLAEGDDRLRHMYVIGKSGTGKSTLFESMLSQDIINGAGVGILDPHGETIDKILDRIPDNRVDDVVYFDPADTEMPIGLNLLQIDDPSQKNLLASGLVSAIKQHFDYSWGPRLEYLLNYAVLTLLEVPGTTMLGITRLLEDDNYQKFILHHVKDPVVLKFWEKEYKEFKGNQKLVTEAIAPIQNKVNRFLASSTIRNILGQKRSTLDLWDAMNSGKIVLMNLSKGKIGADNSNLLGALLVSRIQFYALQRATIPYDQRKPFYLYVDEFQNFATGSFEEILSESRKYKLGLYLTHQFTAQLPETLLKAVYGNVGTIATFSLGAPDAKSLANEFAPYFDSEDIISLQRFEIYIKLMIDGMTSLPFSGRILRPWLPEENVAPKTKNREKVMELSRQKYGVQKEFVEDKMRKWIDTRFDKGMAIALENKKNSPEGGTTVPGSDTLAPVQNDL